MPHSLRISLAQMDVRLGAPETNLQQAAEYAAEAARRNSRLLLLPELWGSGYALERAAELAAPLDAGLFAASAALARRHRIAIGGSLLEAADGRVYNTLPSSARRARCWPPTAKSTASARWRKTAIWKRAAPPCWRKRPGASAGWPCATICAFRNCFASMPRRARP